MSITVFTKNMCPKCDMTKNILDNSGVEYESVNIDESELYKIPNEDREVNIINYIKEELGYTSMPVVVIWGEESFCDFRPDKLEGLK